MYFYAPHPDEPHKEYAGQWREDMMRKLLHLHPSAHAIGGGPVLRKK